MPDMLNYHPEILRYLQADLSLVANTRDLNGFIKVLTANVLCKTYTEILLIQRDEGMQNNVILRCGLHHFGP